MLTRLRIKNFKRFPDADIELGQAVVFIGQNNSGKTTALQALALWDVGLRKWNEEYKGKAVPPQRPGVTINRRDLVAIPVPGANLLWRNLHVRDVRKQNGKQQTQNIRIDIIVDGVKDGKAWSCGLEFDYANDESLYCRPSRLNPENHRLQRLLSPPMEMTEDWKRYLDKNPDRLPVPPEAAETLIAFLPPMSGLTDREFLKQPGEIGFLIGQGETAQVLRNLCYQLFSQAGDRVLGWKFAHTFSLFSACNFSRQNCWSVLKSRWPTRIRRIVCLTFLLRVAACSKHFSCSPGSTRTPRPCSCLMNRMRTLKCCVSVRFTSS